MKRLIFILMCTLSLMCLFASCGKNDVVTWGEGSVTGGDVSESTAQQTTQQASTDELGNNLFDSEHYEIYKEFFYSNFSKNDFVYLIDVTHDGEKEMIAIDDNTDSDDPYDATAYIYTVSDGEVERLSEFRFGNHAVGALYLCAAADGNYNLGLEYWGMWQGYGTVYFEEFYFDEYGDEVEVDTVLYTTESEDEDDATVYSYEAYIKAINKKRVNFFQLYELYSEGERPAKLNAYPVYVFSGNSSQNSSGALTKQDADKLWSVCGEEAYLKWVYGSAYADWSDTATYAGATWQKVRHETIRGVDQLKKYLSQYLTESSYSHLFQPSENYKYVEINGELYSRFSKDSGDFTSYTGESSLEAVSANEYNYVRYFINYIDNSLGSDTFKIVLDGGSYKLDTSSVVHAQGSADSSRDDAYSDDEYDSYDEYTYGDYYDNDTYEDTTSEDSYEQTEAPDSFEQSEAYDSTDSYEQDDEYYESDESYDDEDEYDDSEDYGNSEDVADDSQGGSDDEYVFEIELE